MKEKNLKERTLIFDQKGLKAFALNLKKIRRENNITQTQLAFEAGISLSQIARIETAKINPTLSTVFAIARALDVPIKSLFDFTLP
ncbi:MAG: helix-turn-helix transcriptional regulator [Bacteroidales bacterium]|nr:helix-turn-helix transcriptional regulator [Bacteroidales bacterium]